MLFDFVYLFAIFNLLTLVDALFEKGHDELCFVVVLYRHGDRAPVAPYPNDPYRDGSFWPNGWGQLTRLGKFQQLQLGRWLRSRYGDFIPVRYNASDIYVQSTDVDRTLMSAYCNLAGFYECRTDDARSFLTWQPIPVHTVPVDMDWVLAGHKRCPAYDCLFEDFLHSEEVCEVNEYYEDVFANLSAFSGMKINSVRDSVLLYSALLIETLHGFQLPQWARNYFPDPLTEMAELSFKLPCYTTQLKRLKCGPLLKTIIQLMEDKRAGKLRQKMWMYSAHDTTLANLMQCLNVYDGIIPPYTATLIFELFKGNKDHHVAISYKTPTTFRVLRVPGCDRICSLDAFRSVLCEVLPVDWERECRL